MNALGDGSENRPNIIFIMIESWDGKVLGLYGDPALQRATPNLDRFAKEAVVFRSHYTTHPICCPARANLWSGQYTFHCKSWNNHKGLEKGVPILKDVLQKEGQYVFASNKIGIGKHDYLSGGHTNQNRITAWTGAANIDLPAYHEHRPSVQFFPRQKVHMADWKRTHEAKKFLCQQQQRKDSGDRRPFFLYLSLTTPHPGFRTSKYWLSRINYDQVSIPPQDEEDHPVIRFQRRQKNWPYGFDPKDVQLTRAIYYAMVAETDHFIGEVLDTLHGLDLKKQTYVIITADHGENNMEHQLYYKMNMYESSVNVPLLISGPDVVPNRILGNITSMVDFYPTILDIARIPRSAAPNELDGESLLPLLQGKTDRSRNWAFSMFTGTASNTSQFMLRKGDWKYIAYPGYPPQLFNLKENPTETKNYAAEQPTIVAEMDDALKEIVDYPAVHREWQQYCKESFRAYRTEVQAHPIPLCEYGAIKLRATYDQVMANTYKGWTKAHAAQLEAWLDSTD
jgi:arylsulfatase K